MRKLLITGGTGTIGSAVVAQLLKEPDVQMYLLIRADSSDHLQERFQNMLHFWDVEGNSPERTRLVPILGDAAMPYLGLELKFYNQLSKEITHIVHAAASVKLNMTMEEALQNCSVPAAHILEFALACQGNGNFKKLEYVSTIGVGGRTVKRMVEQRISVEVDFHNTYEAAKFKAEQLVWEKVDQGLPVTVHRPSMVVGHSQSGKIVHFQVFYHLAMFLTGKYTLGVLPLLNETRLDIVPADTVAAGIVCTINNPQTTGRVYHWALGPEKSWSLESLRKFIQEFNNAASGQNKDVWLVPLAQFLFVLKILTWFALANAKRKLKSLYIFLNYATDRHIFDNQAACELLKQSGKAMPEVKDFLPNVFKYYYQNRAH